MKSPEDRLKEELSDQRFFFYLVKQYFRRSRKTWKSSEILKKLISMEIEYERDRSQNRSQK